MCNSNGNRNLWGISGSAGTGKTLLLYDLAKELSNRSPVCIIHCGMLSQGHMYLNSRLDNITIIDAKSATTEVLSQYDIICVDETQRLYSVNMDILLDALNNCQGSICVFSYDYAQVLSRTELNRNNPQRLKSLCDFKERNLSEKIRTNKELFSFVRRMMDIHDKPHVHMRYDNVDIVYANDIAESDYLRRFYGRNGYKFIAFTRSSYVSSSMDHYIGFINSHQVIGQEFDNVVVVLDDNFRYSDEGILQGRTHPNPDYLFPRLFYQNITRAREKLCIIVVNNIELFKKLLSIKEGI